MTAPMQDLLAHDDRKERERAGVALCLSGGGYRAMAFHAGALSRLNELGYLPRLDFVSSVSGGSLAAGVLALAWRRLRLDAAGRAENSRASRRASGTPSCSPTAACTTTSGWNR